MSGLFRDASSLQRIATAVTDDQLERMPALRARYGAPGRQHCIDDTMYHLSYLGGAVELGDATLFEDYISWAKIMLAARGVGAADLIANLQQIREALVAEGEDSSVHEGIAIVEHVLARIPEMPEAAETFLSGEGELEEVARGFFAFIIRGKRQEADTMVRKAMENGASITDLYLRVFEPVQYEIGRLWQMSQITVAQEHFCSAVVQRTMSQLYPMLFTGAPGRRRVVAACAGGELHEIGLRMVTDLLEANGWDTVYLGANVPVESVVKTVAAAPTALVAISATITPHLRDLITLIKALRSAPSTSHVPIMVGGYPFRVSSAVAARIGADGWAANASAAVRLANEIGLRG